MPKSNPFLAVVSAPQKSDDMMFNIMIKESFETTPFKRLFVDYTYGVGKIYDQSEIDKIKNSRSFPREYGFSLLAWKAICLNQSLSIKQLN